jgi:hypothetical protein
MIRIDAETYQKIMQALLDASTTEKRHAAIKALKLSMIQSIVIELKYAHELPALLRKQAN